MVYIYTRSCIVHSMKLHCWTFVRWQWKARLSVLWQCSYTTRWSYCIDLDSIKRCSVSLTWNWFIHIRATSIGNLVSWSIPIHSSGEVFVVSSLGISNPCISQGQITTQNIRWGWLGNAKASSKSAFYLEQGFLWENNLQKQKHESGLQWL